MIPNDARVSLEAGNAIAGILSGHASSKLLRPIGSVGSARQELALLLTTLPGKSLFDSNYAASYQVLWTAERMLAFWYCAERYLRARGMNAEAKVFAWLRSLPEDTTETARMEYPQEGGASELAIAARVLRGQPMHILAAPEWRDAGYIGRDPACLLAYTHPAILLGTGIMGDYRGKRVREPKLWRNAFYTWEYLWSGEYAVNADRAATVPLEENTLIGRDCQGETLRKRTIVYNASIVSCKLDQCTIAAPNCCFEKSKVTNTVFETDSASSFKDCFVRIKSSSFHVHSMASTDFMISGNLLVETILGGKTKANSVAALNNLGHSIHESPEQTEMTEITCQVLTLRGGANGCLIHARGLHIESNHREQIVSTILSGIQESSSIEAVRFQDVVAKQCNFRGTKRLYLLECSLFGCALGELTGSSNTEFVKCDFQSSTFMSGIFLLSDFSKQNLDRAKFEKPTFTQCDLRGTVFRASKVTEVTFKECKRAPTDRPLPNHRVFSGILNPRVPTKIPESHKVYDHEHDEMVDVDYGYDGPSAPYLPEGVLEQNPKNWYESKERIRRRKRRVVH